MPSKRPHDGIRGSYVRKIDIRPIRLANGDTLPSIERVYKKIEKEAQRNS